MAVNSVWNGIQHRIFVDDTALKRSHHHHRLNRRTRFKHVGDGTVTHRVFRRTGKVVGVIGRAIRHRQYFTGIDIDQHRATGLRLVKRHRVVQFAVNQRL
ncbi:Uncharacterised protein [Salmonella enterica subsp. enterica serovar Bovismorbificans]|uniref:Uncharacterized protein n=1 Tax=Salmonella enterica subsp. enterica serovar Bovismorbificans TaxID=58097 RepID=A0A655CI44_SALET|nr:Uncharacterised protein [Salmonella enterica subsp. enterica serovar Bovismorbificans]